MATKIFVGVAHDVNIISGAEFDASIRKYVGGEVIKTLPKTGLLNAKIESRKIGMIDNVPDFDKVIMDCDEYPSGYDIVIVSPLYASAYRKKFGYIPENMRLVADPVMGEKGIRGCLGLAKPF